MTERKVDGKMGTMFFACHLFLNKIDKEKLTKTMVKRLEKLGYEVKLTKKEEEKTA
jgi:hypothetical protein